MKRTAETSIEIIQKVPNAPQTALFHFTLHFCRGTGWKPVYKFTEWAASVTENAPKTRA